MPQFRVGERIRIRCEVQKGAFPTESLVTFETSEGPISGFVRSDILEDADEGEGFLPATVLAVSQDTLTVKVEGSFFTTTGLAYLDRDWAKSHVQPSHA